MIDNAAQFQCIAHSVKVLALVSDAFGGRGGIAQYNRDFFQALITAPEIDSITIIPRLGDASTDPLPVGVVQEPAIPGRMKYTFRAVQVAREVRPDVVYCGHLYMLPLAALIARSQGAQLWLQTHGVDAWDTPRSMVRIAAQRCNLVLAVSRYTRDRMLNSWLNIEPWRVRVLSNTVRDVFCPGEATDTLRAALGVDGKKVILTLSRISINDSFKGHDKVMRALPAITRAGYDVIYLIAGDGDGVSSLRKTAEDQGVASIVRFIGSVPTAELPDLYRLADVFVMPSEKEGFGIVFIEAAASGIPVVGGRYDGSWDALREGELGFATDPQDSDELVAAITAALRQGRRTQRGSAEVFSNTNFIAHIHRLVGRITEYGNSSTSPK